MKENSNGILIFWMGISIIINSIPVILFPKVRLIFLFLILINICLILIISIKIVSLSDAPGYQQKKYHEQFWLSFFFAIGIGIFIDGANLEFFNNIGFSVQLIGIAACIIGICLFWMGYIFRKKNRIMLSTNYIGPTGMLQIQNEFKKDHNFVIKDNYITDKKVILIIIYKKSKLQMSWTHLFTHESKFKIISGGTSREWQELFDLIYAKIKNFS